MPIKLSNLDESQVDQVLQATAADVGVSAVRSQGQQIRMTRLYSTK